MEYNEGNGRLRRTVEEKGNETWEFQLLFWEIFFRASNPYHRIYKTNYKYFLI